MTIDDRKAGNSRTNIILALAVALIIGGFVWFFGAERGRSITNNVNIQEKAAPSTLLSPARSGGSSVQ